MGNRPFVAAVLALAFAAASFGEGAAPAPPPAPVELLRLPPVAAGKPERVLEGETVTLEREGEEVHLDIVRLREGAKILWENLSLSANDAGKSFLSASAAEYDGLLWLGHHVYLLGLDPATGVVKERRRLPGKAKEVAPHPDGGLLVRAEAWANKNPLTWESRFTDGVFAKPVYWGSSLLERMNGLRRSQFLHPAFALPGEKCGEKPAPYLASRALFDRTAQPAKDCPPRDLSLPEAERLYREAMAQDPTQPWHAFYLGQALWWQEQKTEAEALWQGMLAGHEYMPYYEYAWMAAYFEQLGQRGWADAAWEKTAALFRSQVPQGPAAVTLLEVLINLPTERYGGWSARASGDWRRGRLWTERRRELTGNAPVEGEEITSRLWAHYFKKNGGRAGRRAGDPARGRFLERCAGLHSLGRLHGWHTGLSLRRRGGMGAGSGGHALAGGGAALE